MPLTSVVCSCEKTFTPQGVLDHLDDRKSGCEFTYEVAASIIAQVQDREDRISTTTLTTKCIRSEVLKRKEPYTETLMKQWAAFRGTLYHGQLEAFEKPSSIAEARYWMNLDGLGPFSGSPDLVDPVHGVLYDYKTNKENPRWSYPWADHVEQVNINRWIVDHAEKVEYQGDMLSMADPDILRRFRPKEWHSLVLVYMDDKGPKVLTCTRSEEVLCKNGNKRKARVPDIWSDDRVESLVREKYAIAKAALLPSSDIPAIPESFQYWQHPLCNFCPVKRRCVELELAGRRN